MEREGLGRTPQFAEVALPDVAVAECPVPVRITGYSGTRLVGEVVA
jgi:hypothetical protein